MERKSIVPVWTEPASWAFAAGAAVWWIVLSSGFGWMSEGTAVQMAARQTQTAVVVYATPACVARFGRQPNAVVAWEALNKIERWDRSDVIKKGGWVAEPNQKLESDIASMIAADCAEKIAELKTLAGVKLSAKK